MLGPGLAALLEPIRFLTASSRLRRAEVSGLAERYDFGAVNLLRGRDGPLLRGAGGRRRYRARLESNINENEESCDGGHERNGFLRNFGFIPFLPMQQHLL